MGESVQLNMKLLRPYPFDECTFDFTDPRCKRSIACFGDAEFTQEVTVPIGVAEEYSRAVEYRREFEEKVAVSESYEIKPSLFSIFVESIGLSNPHTPMLETRTERKLSITEKKTNQISREHTSGISLREKHDREFRAQRTFVERIPLHVTHAMRIEQTHIERIGIHGEIIPAPRSEFTEHISIYDGVLRASDASLSGVVIGTGMTLEDFKKYIIRSVGYEEFRPFHVGDYEYEKALVRISITAGSFGAIPKIYDVAMNVDIDDTVDRGTAQMKAEETVVPFHKHYYTKPEVTATIMGGNTADGIVLPEITAIGTESFTCVLRKRDGSAAAGTISWTAVGY